MPAALRLELESAVAAHIKQHERGRHYGLLRDDPRFSPWIGPHLGHRGEKYLDRVVARVLESQERVRRLKRRPAAPGTDSKPALGRELGDAGAVRFSDLMGDLSEQRSALKAEQAACYDGDGDMKDLDRWLIIAAEVRAVDKATLEVSKQYQATLKPAEVRAAINQRIAQELAGDPERARRLADDLNAIIRQHTGLNGTSGNISS